MFTDTLSLFIYIEVSFHTVVNPSHDQEEAVERTPIHPMRQTDNSLTIRLEVPEALLVYLAFDWVQTNAEYFNLKFL
tara:strand:+ start:151 stop:381 length:231 start_codon:yes stop_codon:yes gene_type:complete